MYFWGSNSWSDPKGHHSQWRPWRPVGKTWTFLPQRNWTFSGDTPSPVLTLQRKRICQDWQQMPPLHCFQQFPTVSFVIATALLLICPWQISVGKEHAVALTEGGRVFVP